MESTSQPDTHLTEEKEKEERMMARRQRVQAKLEAKRKAEAGEEPQEVRTYLNTTYHKTNPSSKKGKLSVCYAM